MSLINFLINLSMKFPFKNIDKPRPSNFSSLFDNYAIFIEFGYLSYSLFIANDLIELFFVMFALYRAINFIRNRLNSSFLFIKIMSLIHYVYNRFINYVIRTNYVLILSIRSVHGVLLI